ATGGREPGMPGMNEDVSREVEQFLYREARLLDERRFHEWLELLTDDVRYWMAARTNRYPKISKAIAILDPASYVEDDMTKENELAIFDEVKQSLSGRVARLDTGMAWAEDPPSRTRHLITNIEIEAGEADSELRATAGKRPTVASAASAWSPYRAPISPPSTIRCSAVRRNMRPACCGKTAPCLRAIPVSRHPPRRSSMMR